MKYYLIIPALLIASLSLFSQPVKKVLLIGIDGCRVDALEAANTPNIDALIANGIYSPDALMVGVTKSGPGWSAMLTGVWSDKHMVSNNDFSTNNYADYPPIFKFVEQFDSNINTASISRWDKINAFIVTDNADYTLNVTVDSLVGLQAAYLLSTNDPDFMFIHFDRTDLSGHGSGFSPNNPLYMTAIENADQYIGYVIDALEARPSYANEDWLILVSTDHGGIGTVHGGQSIEERNIFVIVSGDNIPTTVIRKDTIGIAPNDSLDYSNTPRTVDIPITILNHLCVPIDTSWELAGTSFIPSCADQCSKPFNPQETIQSATSVMLSWTPIVNASSYTIQGGIMGSSNYVNLTTSSPSLLVNSLVAGTSYEWQVSSTCGSGNSDFSDLSFFTMSPPCTAPVPIHFSALTPTSVNLNWTSNPAASSYIILGRRIGNPNITIVNISNGSTNSFAVSGLTPEINYEWTIQTVCSNGDTSGIAPINYFTTPALSAKVAAGKENIEADLFQLLEIYPVPAEDYLMVKIANPGQVKNLTFQIFDVNGIKLIHQFQSINIGQSAIEIDLDQLAKGFYYLVIAGTNQRITEKLIIR